MMVPRTVALVIVLRSNLFLPQFLALRKLILCFPYNQRVALMYVRRIKIGQR